MDLVTHVSHLPQAGETISSLTFQTHPGGKGANQAAAAAKLGANVKMIGKVGSDEYGSMLLNSLKHAGVGTEGILRSETTGMAFITVSSAGENSIVLVPGANNELTPADIERLRYLIEASDIMILQLEIPLTTVEHALRLGVELKKEVILNPAPAQALPDELLQTVPTLILNETELAILTGMPVSTKSEAISAAEQVKSMGVKRVIVTLGGQGSYLINNYEQYYIPAVKVEAVDTTAAGDAYIAAFAVGLTRKMNDAEAAKFASHVSAIVVTREGAQPSLPTLEEVEASISQEK